MDIPTFNSGGAHPEMVMVEMGPSPATPPAFTLPATSITNLPSATEQREPTMLMTNIDGHTDLVTFDENGNMLRQVSLTISSNPPAGGQHGDIWFVV